MEATTEMVMCIGSALTKPGLYLVSSKGTTDSSFNMIARVIGKAPFFKFKIVDNITFQDPKGVDLTEVHKFYFKPLTGYYAE